MASHGLGAECHEQFVMVSPLMIRTTYTLRFEETTTTTGRRLVRGATYPTRTHSRPRKKAKGGNMQSQLHVSVATAVRVYHVVAPHSTHLPLLLRLHVRGQKRLPCENPPGEAHPQPRRRHNAHPCARPFTQLRRIYHRRGETTGEGRQGERKMGEW